VWKIISLLIALPTIIVAIFILVIQNWLEGLITTPLLEAFNVPSAIIAIITIVGIFVLGTSIFKIIADAV